MTRTTEAEHSLMASGGDDVSRGVVIGTRDAQWQAIVSAVNRDSVTNGIFSLDLTSITGGNDPTDCYPGMSLDVGTSAGARDIGTVRIRFYGSDADTVTIAETAFAELPVEVGHYVTARLEYLPWKIPKRFVETLDMSGDITAVDVFLDYDLAFSGGAHPFPPKGNITSGHNADGTPKHVLPFAWEDTPGCGYRTIHLSALDSVVHNPGETLGTILWFIEGGVIINGGVLTDPEIDIQFSLGFHYIHLLVADTSTRQDLFYRHMPLWCDSKADPQFVLRNFNVTSDETEAGRDLQLEFFGQPNEADASVIPVRSLVCYFEEPEWTDGDTPPESYRLQTLGWVTDDTPLLKIEESTYGIRIGGTEHFKRAFRALSVTLLDTGSTPTTWTEMEHITIDRALNFSLYGNDTLWSLMNVYYSGYAAEVATVTLAEGDSWSQLGDCAAHGALGVVGCDSLGNLFVRRPYWGLSPDQRGVVPEALRVTNADWADQDGLELPTLYLKPSGSIKGGGEVWVSGGRAVFASRAPGLRESYGTGQGEMPGQWLQTPTPQADLNRFTGLYYWHENLARPTISLILLGNLDVLEPCWQQPILITWLDDTIRGETLDAAPFLVKHISTQHTNAPDETTPPKRITWTLEQIISGDDGETAPVDAQMSGVTPPVDGTCEISPSADVSVDGCLATFTDTSTGDLIFARLWDFGDGSSPSSETIAVHGYAVPGDYDWTLYVASDCGTVDTVTGTVTISAESIAAGFTDSHAGLTVSFADTSTADSGVIAWSWVLGDGATSSMQAFDHAYIAAGTYTVSLTSTSACGTTDTVSREVAVSETLSVPPTLIFKKGDTNAAAFSNDGHLYTTSNFQAGSPTWTDHNLSATIPFIIDAWPDPFSPLYLGLGGTTVDAWVLDDGRTTDGKLRLYKVADVFGSRTINLKFTSTDVTISDSARMVVSRYQANTLAIAYTESAATTPSKVVATQDGTSFTTGRVEPTDIPGNPGWSDHCWIFANGTIVAVAQREEMGAPVSHYYTSTDNAATFTIGAQSPSEGITLVPFSYPLVDESLLYESISSPVGFLRSGSDISPIESVNSAKVILRKQRGLAFYTGDENRVYLVGKATSYQEEAYYDAATGGLAWTFSQHNSAGVVTYDGCMFADADGDTVVAWGVNQIGYTEALSTPLANKAGASKTFVGVCFKP